MNPAIAHTDVFQVATHNEAPLPSDAVLLEGLPRYCPIKAGLLWGSVILVCTVAIAISVFASIDLIYSSFWVLFSALATFFFMSKSAPVHQQIAISHKGVSISCAQGRRRKFASIKDLKIMGMCWVTDSGQPLPAIKIKSSKIGTVILGFNQRDEEWVSYWKAISKPELIVSDYTSWRKITSLLQCE